MIRIKNKRLQIALFVPCAIVLLHLFYGTHSFNFESYGSTYATKETVFLKSECACHTQTVTIRPIENKVYRIYVDDSANAENNYSYDMPMEMFKRLELTCDLYKVLRRGINQKVISFSLYGKKRLYERYLLDNVRAAKKLYPHWILRIYHDDTINVGIKCGMECERDEKTGDLLNNVDFCDIKRVPTSFEETRDRSYMWPMTWRWLPIGDYFVNMFISRDTDSTIFDREVFAVEDWLKTNTVFHVMRDNPAHGTEGYYIPGGMWGMKTRFNRYLSKTMYNIITSRFIAFWYGMYKGDKGHDQFILNWYFWPYVKSNVTIHDSYTCAKFGGKAFPEQRPPYESCFVGSPGSCSKGRPYTIVCPTECRPKDHQDWIYC